MLRLGVGLLLLSVPGLAVADVRVEFLPPGGMGNPLPLSGELVKETPSGITLRPRAGTPVDLLPEQIVKIIYEDVKDRVEYAKAQNADAQGDDALALKSYRKQLDSYPTQSPTRQHILFRIGMLEAALGNVDEALNVLDRYTNRYPNSWQFTLAIGELSRVQLSVGRPREAARTLERFLKTPNLSQEQQQNAQLRLIDAQIRSGQLTEANTLIKSLRQGRARVDPFGQQLDILALLSSPTEPINQRARKLEGIIDGARDPKLKALGYNALGDLYQQADQPREAMWSYLWVDVVFNQDPLLHRKAVEELVSVFGKLNDPDRVKLYQAKLKNLR